MRGLLLLALSLSACGRTAPVRLPQDAGSRPGPTGDGGIVVVTAQPLVVDLDLGVLTAHRLDGGVAFQQVLAPSSRGRTFEQLFGGEDAVAWTFAPGGAFPSFGVTRADGSLAFELQNSPGVGQVFVTAEGVVVGTFGGGVFVDGAVAHQLSLEPLGGATAGVVPVVDDVRSLAWVDPRTDAVVRRSRVAPLVAAAQRGGRLYSTTPTTVAESSPTEDLTLPVPFAQPVLRAASRARLALLADPRSPRLALADFPRGTVKDVTLAVPGLTPLDPAVDSSLTLDDDGFLYATFVGPGRLQLMRTDSLGASWARVVDLPLAGVTQVALRPFGERLLVVGGTDRGPSVAAWNFAVLVDVATGASAVLPLQPGQSTLVGRSPVAVSADGQRAAFWAPADGGVVLTAFDFTTGTTSALELRQPEVDAIGQLPCLSWLE